MNYLRVVLTFLALIAITASQAQVKKEIELEPQQDIEKIITIPNSEDVIIEIKEEQDLFSKKRRLIKLNENLDQKWDITFDEYLINTNIINSNLSDYTFYIGNNKKHKKSEKTYIVYRIDQSGKNDQLQLVLPKEDLVASYTDNKGLFYITSKEDEKTKSKDIVIHQLYHDSKKFEKISLTINDLIGESVAENRFIEFLGQDENNIYLSQKMISLTKNAIKYVVYTISKDGFINISEDEFIVELKHTIIPAKNLRNNEGAIIETKDYNRKVHYDGKNIIVSYTVYEGAYGCSKLDVKTGLFYAYGMVSDIVHVAPDKKSKTSSFSGNYVPVGGYYVHKFDFNTGKLISSTENLFDNKTIDEFNKVALGKSHFFFNRTIWLDVIDSVKTTIGIRNFAIGTSKLNYATNEKFLINVLLKDGEKPVFLKYNFQNTDGKGAQKFPTAFRVRTVKSSASFKYTKEYEVISSESFTTVAYLSRLFNPLIKFPQPVTDFSKEWDNRTATYTKSVAINSNFALLITNYSLNKNNSHIQIEKYNYSVTE